MTERVSEHTIQQVAEETNQLDPETLFARMDHLSEVQPNLLGFMVEFTQELSQPAREQAMYLFFVTYRTFREAHDGDLPTITPEVVIDAFEYNEDMLEGLQDAPSDFWSATAREEAASQPYLVRYVVEGLFATSAEAEPAEELNEEEQGYLFLLLKTVIDALDRAEE